MSFFDEASEFFGLVSDGQALAMGFAVGGVAAYLLYYLSTRTDVPFIKGLPEIPGAIPVFGHLLQLGDDHATVCEGWWKQYGTKRGEGEKSLVDQGKASEIGAGNWDVFQMRLGNTRAVVVNSWETARGMLIGHQSALIDRPTLYTFHGIISSTKGFTIGSSPWDDSCKNKRTAAGQALGRAKLSGYWDMFDLESYCLVRDLAKDYSLITPRPNANGEDGREISVRKYIQRYALNTTLTLCYGIRMDSVDDTMLKEILEVGSAISLLRSASENYQDYVPILRYWPRNEKNRRSKELRDRRDLYLDQLLDRVRGMIERGTDKPCIAAAILKDEETKLSNVEVSSICLSLVSGGFETIPGTLTSCIGSLSTPEGQVFQDKAYEEILKCYPTVQDAWSESFKEEKVEYLSAIVKEAARYYTVSAMSLPRKTVTEIVWNGVKIPAKTMVLINAQAANHDTTHFGPSASTFDPERWLSPSTSISSKPVSGPQHFSFGAGSRACSGQIIANRLLYTALMRIIVSFKIVGSEDNPPNTDYVDYNNQKSALVAIPREFGVRLVRRDGGAEVDGGLGVLETCLKEARKRTEGAYRDE